MLELSKTYKVIYLEPPVALVSNLIKHRGRWLEWVRGNKRMRKIGREMYADTPFVPFHFKVTYVLPFLKRINHLISSVLIRRRVRKLHSGNVILWVPVPYWMEWADICHVFKKALLVYDCGDECSAFDGMSALDVRKAVENERQIIGQSDIVLVVTEKLRTAKSVLSAKVHLVRNGVTVDRFRPRDGYENNEFSKIPRPVIGYMGNIQKTLVDLDLLRYIARSRPSWSLVLVGPVNIDTEELSGMDNVWLAGQKPYWELPDFAAHFDVCIIPSRVNDLMKSADVLKLYEYLALGKPVVSVDLEQARNLQEVVRIGCSPAEFVDCIEDALRDRDEGMIKRALELARENSWEKRAEQVLRIIESALREKAHI